MTPLDCADLRRRAENGSVVGGRAGEVLALLDLAARLKAALELVVRDDTEDGVTGNTIDAVMAALAAAREAKL